MKTHRIKPKTYSVKKDKPMTLDDAFELAFPGLPQAAVCFAGIRHYEGLTQKEFAELLGMKQHHISEIENGKRNIGKELAKRIAKQFNRDYRIFL